MGKYSGADKVSMNRVSLRNYVGKHLVEVVSVEEGENYDGDDIIAPAFRVLVSGNDNLREGVEVGLPIKDGTGQGHRERFFRQVKAALAPHIGEANGNITGEQIEELVGPEQPSVGVVLEANVYLRAWKNKQTGKSGESSVVDFAFVASDAETAMKVLSDAE